MNRINKKRGVTKKWVKVDKFGRRLKTLPNDIMEIIKSFVLIKREGRFLTNKDKINVHVMSEYNENKMMRKLPYIYSTLDSKSLNDILTISTSLSFKVTGDKIKEYADLHSEELNQDIMIYRDKCCHNDRMLRRIDVLTIHSILLKLKVRKEYLCYFHTIATEEVVKLCKNEIQLTRDALFTRERQFLILHDILSEIRDVGIRQFGANCMSSGVEIIQQISDMYSVNWQFYNTMVNAVPYALPQRVRNLLRYINYGNVAIKSRVDLTNLDELPTQKDWLGRVCISYKMFLCTVKELLYAIRRLCYNDNNRMKVELEDNPLLFEPIYRIAWMNLNTGINILLTNGNKVWDEARDRHCQTVCTIMYHKYKLCDLANTDHVVPGSPVTYLVDKYLKMGINKDNINTFSFELFYNRDFDYYFEF